MGTLNRKKCYLAYGVHLDENKARLAVLLTPSLYFQCQIGEKIGLIAWATGLLTHESSLPSESETSIGVTGCKSG
ncbi:hypothetical protein QCA50_005190 [Cerrena zonata]|uniref:Uncharacterized protein n=1 Tax=Cerrena zonata TaxID=2478898 RepID=A0AAW0GIW9_9APHY